MTLAVDDTADNANSLGELKLPTVRVADVTPVRISTSDAANEPTLPLEDIPEISIETSTSLNELVDKVDVVLLSDVEIPASTLPGGPVVVTLVNVILP